MNLQSFSSCHLGFCTICSHMPVNDHSDLDSDGYTELRSYLNLALNEYVNLDAEFNRAYKAYEFLQTHPTEKGLVSYLNDTFALEEVTGLPRECFTMGKMSTSVCMEGLGSVLVNVVKKIIEFFKKLHDTIMRFFGIKTFRQRKIEGDLIAIKRKIENMSDFEFKESIKQNVQCNVMTMRVSELDKLIDDVQSIYGTLNNHKDIDNIRALVSATGGMLTKIGYRTEYEYKIVVDKGLPYNVFEANQTLNIESSFGIRDKATVLSRIAIIDRILNTVTDIQRWYPANLKKYATRASEIKIDPNDPSTVSLHEESIRKLNDEQKCQAYMCKFIVIYLELVDMMCARAIATFGSITR